jgi:hypothetical protein
LIPELKGKYIFGDFNTTTPTHSPFCVTYLPRASALPKFLMLFAISVVPVGCGDGTRNQVVPQKNPTPLPDPSSRIELNDSATSIPDVHSSSRTKSDQKDL